MSVRWGPCCSAVLQWDAVDPEKVNEGRAEMRVRLLEARLDELQRTVADLGSGDGLEPVLSRVMAGAMRAVQAPSFILDIKASATSNHFIRTDGHQRRPKASRDVGSPRARGERDRPKRAGV